MFEFKLREIETMILYKMIENVGLPLQTYSNQLCLKKSN